MNGIGLNTGRRLFRINPTFIQDARSRPTEPTPITKIGQDKALLKQLHVDVVRLRGALVGLGDAMSVAPATGTITNAAAGAQGGPVTLNVQGSNTTRESKEEVNATDTSFTPFGPDWQEGSDSLATVEGIYEKSYGDDELTFKVTQGGEVGTDKIKVGVYQKSGALLQTVTIQKWHDPGKKYGLKNGLKVSFDEGSLQTNDTFGVDTSATVGSVVDPNKAFDGMRNANPNLQYGKKVTAGTFKVNGEQIAVAANDSINSVLQKINDSDANVTASFDAATERIKLTHKETGNNSISLSNDNSGFFAATKLNGSATNYGSLDERDVKMFQVNALKPIKSGTITVNGTDIAIDRKEDTLNEVISRINAADTGAVASFDEATLQFKIENTDPNETLEVDSGNTKFFETLEIVEGSHEPSGGIDEATLRKKNLIQAAKAAKKLAGVQREFENVFRRLDGLTQTETVQRYRKQINDAFTIQLGTDEETTVHRTGHGISADTTRDADRAFKFRTRGRGSFTESFIKDREELRHFISGEENTRNVGLVGNLDSAIKAVESSLSRQTGTEGLLIDAFG